MASKICPSCGAKNPSDAYSCSNCAASLIEMPSASFPNQSSTQYGTSSASPSWTSVPQQNQGSASAPSTQRRYEQQQPPATTTVTSTSTISTGEIPIAVVSQSPLMSVANSFVSTLFLLIFGFGAGVSSFGLLVEIAYVVGVVAVPSLIGYLLRPKYEFYETHMVRQARGGRQEVPYSEIQTVDQRRGQILLYLKQAADVPVRMLRRSRIAIPGNPKLSMGTDLASWLQTKITPVKEKESGESEEDSSENGM